MRIERFEDIEARKNARVLSGYIFAVCKDMKDWSFKDQIRRATISISNNIAEGFERQTNNELRQFLYIAKGSCAEVRSMLYLAYDLSYITSGQSEKLHELAIVISKQLSNFIKVIK